MSRSTICWWRYLSTSKRSPLSRVSVARRKTLPATSRSIVRSCVRSIAKIPAWHLLPNIEIEIEPAARSSPRLDVRQQSRAYCNEL